MKKNDRVKILKTSTDFLNGDSCPMEPKYIGMIGTVTYAGMGKTVGDMPIVEFEDGSHDAFWPEELEVMSTDKDPEDERFWIDDSPIVTPFPVGSNYAIIDEEDGGIIAYANTEYRAKLIVEALS